MGLIRDSFIIFKNWTDAINTLPEEYQLEAYKSLVAYGTTGQIPDDISQITKALLISFSVGMENSICRYNASVNNGKLGGRPPKNKEELKTQENLAKPNKTQLNLNKPSNSKENPNEPNHNLNVNVNVNDNVNLEKKINKEKNTALASSENSSKDFLTDKEIVSYIKEQIKDEKVCNKFLDFYNMRKAMGKRYAMRTIATVDTNISHLRNWAKTTDDAIAILDYSISNNYQGLFKPKNDTLKTRESQKQNVSSAEAKVWES